MNDRPLAAISIALLLAGFAFVWWTVTPSDSAPPRDDTREPSKSVVSGRTDAEAST